MDICGLFCKFIRENLSNQLCSHPKIFYLNMNFYSTSRLSETFA